MPLKKFSNRYLSIFYYEQYFYPVHDDQHAIKVTASVQEWCGWVYSQLNNKKRNLKLVHILILEKVKGSATSIKISIENELWIKSDTSQSRSTSNR
jgi:hypothetical protein